MPTLREWLQRLLGTLRLRRADADLEDELRSHAEMAGGGYAGRVAVTQAMDAVRDRRGLPWLHALSADVVFGWRQLVSRPVVSLAAILSLGLAIGATSAVFRLVDAVLLRPPAGCRTGAPGVRRHLVRRRSAAPRLLRQLGLSDLHALRRHGRRPGRSPARGVERTHRGRAARRVATGARQQAVLLGQRLRRVRLAAGGGSAVRSRGRSHAGRPPGRRARVRLLAASLRRGSAGRRQSAAARWARPRGDWRRARRLYRDRAGPRRRRLRAGADERGAARQARLGLVPAVGPAARRRDARLDRAALAGGPAARAARGPGAAAARRAAATHRRHQEPPRRIAAGRVGRLRATEGLPPSAVGAGLAGRRDAA